MEKLKNINFPLFLLVLISVRMLFPDASIALSIFGLGLIGLYGYSEYLSRKFTKSLDQKVREELESIKSVVSGLSVKSGMKPQNKDPLKFF